MNNGRLVEAALPMQGGQKLFMKWSGDRLISSKVCFHRAIDMARSAVEGLPC